MKKNYSKTYDERRKANGYVKLRVWIKPTWRIKIDRLINKLLEGVK